MVYERSPGKIYLEEKINEKGLSQKFSMTQPVFRQLYYKTFIP